MQQSLLAIFVIFVGIGAIVFSRFFAEEGLKWWVPGAWPKPSPAVARVVVIVSGLVLVFLGLQIMMR